MPRYFLDTSALIERYHAEAGTPEVQRILSEAGSEHFISRLATVEILSGFAVKVRTGALSSAAFGKLRERFLADVKKRLLKPLRVLNLHHQLAADFIGKHGLSRQLRTLDSIQLAVALHLHRSEPIDHFVCADQRLGEIAILEGLKVLNPDQP